MSGSAVSLIRPSTPPSLRSPVSIGASTDLLLAQDGFTFLVTTPGVIVNVFIDLPPCSEAAVGTTYHFVVMATTTTDTIILRCNAVNTFIGNLSVDVGGAGSNVVPAVDNGEGPNSVDIEHANRGSSWSVTMVSSSQWRISGSCLIEAGAAVVFRRPEAN